MNYVEQTKFLEDLIDYLLDCQFRTKWLKLKHTYSGWSHGYTKYTNDNAGAEAFPVAGLDFHTRFYSRVYVEFRIKDNMLVMYSWDTERCTKVLGSPDSLNIWQIAKEHVSNLVSKPL